MVLPLRNSPGGPVTTASGFAHVSSSHLSKRGFQDRNIDSINDKSEGIHS